MTFTTMKTITAIMFAAAAISMTTSVHATEDTTDAHLGTADVLNRGAGVTNKNTLVTDNNVFVSNSNLLFRSNDRVSLARKIESLALSEAASSDMDTATLSNGIMRIMQTATDNDITMSKASGVLASKASGVASAAQGANQSGSLDDLRQRIMDLVSSAMSN